MTSQELLQRLERCFDKGEIETLVNWEPGQGLTVSRAAG
jgi:hypothetical protein